jgi:Protein of unknown function (DUF2934)
MPDTEKFQDPHRDPTFEEIRDRAYQLYIERGADDGRDLDDWLAAEAELMGLQERAYEPFPQRSKAARAGDTSSTD